MARILVADDALYVRHVVGELLRTLGHEIAGEAASGTDAIRRYGELRPDVVLMDLNMPGGDGLTAARAIKQLDPFARVVLMSVLVNDSRAAEAERLGAVLLDKPFGLEQLAAAIARATQAGS